MLRVGAGADEVYGEPGGDTIYLLNDNAKDVVYCGTVSRRRARRQGRPGQRPRPARRDRQLPAATTQRLTAPWDLLKLTLQSAPTEWRVSSTDRTAASSNGSPSQSNSPRSTDGSAT